MSKILFLILSFSSVFVSAQSGLQLRSWVKEDTVLLKWLPESADGLKEGLRKGYVLSRNNTEIIIKPWNERKIMFEDNDYLDLIDEFLTTESEIADRLYFMLMVGSGPDKELSKMLGIYYEDYNTSEKEINYTIRYFFKEQEANWNVNTDKTDVNQQFSELNVEAKPRTGEVYLSWNAASLKKGYSGYWIEKSENGIDFQKVNSSPWIFFVNTEFPDREDAEFVDTSTVEGNTYFYRVQGINHFGELGEKSNTVEIKIPRGLNGFTVIDTVEAVDFNRIIRGEYREGKPKEINDIGKFLLYKSDSLMHSYELVSEKRNLDGSFEFSVNSDLKTGDRQYYKVASIGIDQDTSYSFPYYFFTLDQEPPSLPSDFKGVISDSGIVSLSWNASIDKDIQGYRIFRSNSLNEEFVEVTKELKSNLNFYDTLSLKNLTREIYYKIRAVDDNFNNSELSEPILILKPDYIAPVPARINYYNTIDGELHIGWINSTSDDVSINYLIREKGNYIDTAYTWSNKDTLHVDTLLDKPDDYTYYIITEDESGNQGLSTKKNISFEPGYRNAPKNFEAKANIENKTVDLSWTQNKEKPYAIYIYRSGEDQKFRLIETLFDYNSHEYSDNTVRINNVYSYKIRIMYASGISSKMSEAVQVTF